MAFQAFPVFASISPRVLLENLRKRLVELFSLARTTPSADRQRPSCCLLSIVAAPHLLASRQTATNVA
jgi:hypothetical protein